MLKITLFSTRTLQLKKIGDISYNFDWSIPPVNRYLQFKTTITILALKMTANSCAEIL